MTQSLQDHAMTWDHVERFLRLGHELGTYEVPLPDLWRTPTPALDTALKQDGPALVRLAAKTLMTGRPHRPEHAVFVLAKAIAHGTPATRQSALNEVPVALRTGVQLFQLLGYLEDHAKWDSKLRAALRAWYTTRSTTELANVILRSPHHGSWNHRKALGIAAPNPPTKPHGALFRWVQDGTLDPAHAHEPGLDHLAAYQALQATQSLTVVLTLLTRWPLLREHIPARWLRSPEVWRLVLPTLSLEALVRWMPRMADNDLVQAGDSVHALTAQRLREIEKRGTTSPFAALVALGAIRAGCAERDTTAPDAVESALLAMFHQRTRATARLGGTLVIAIDPAASKAADGLPALPGLSPRTAFAALALMAAARAQVVHVLAFGQTLTPMALGPDDTLENLLAKLDAVPQGPTDGAAPIEWATSQGIAADAFLVLNGTCPAKAVSRTWASLLHHRSKTGRATRWLAVSAGAHRLCPEPCVDGRMVEAHGLDASVPSLIMDLLDGPA
jgi:hypothetical protein